MKLSAPDPLLRQMLLYKLGLLRIGRKAQLNAVLKWLALCTSLRVWASS